jgi:tRNA threonylcarbamoyladenosine biosynthesis protein TsaB
MPAGVRHGQALIPMLKDAIEEAGISREGLELVAMALGPGSYTSLRVGLATGRSLAYALGIPVHGVASFDALAHELSTEGPTSAARLVISADAYRGEVYRAVYRREDGGDWSREGAISISPPTALFEDLPRPIAAYGDASERYPELLKPEGVLWPDPPRVRPHARTVAELGLRAFLRGERCAPAGVLPLYLKPSLPKPSPTAGGGA